MNRPLDTQDLQLVQEKAGAMLYDVLLNLVSATNDLDTEQHPQYSDRFLRALELIRQAHALVSDHPKS